MLKPDTCKSCVLYRKHISNGFSVPDGLGTSGIAIIGEALGHDEAIDGKPFRPRAQAGSKLEECFRLASEDLLTPVTRDQFYIWNVIACQPYGNLLEGMWYEEEAINSCKVHFEQTVGRFCQSNPNVVLLALGNVPLRYLTGVSGVAKEKQSISHLRGYTFRSKYGLVLPSLHPSYLKRGKPEHTPLLVEDIKRAIGIKNGTFTSYSLHSSFIRPKYIEHPSLDTARSYYYKLLDSPNRVLAYDIETEETPGIEEDERDALTNNEIVQVQFSTKKGHAIVFPYRGEFIGIIDKMLRLRNRKINQNTWNFDNPILESKGHKVEGRVDDLMWMFKQWHPRLPRGLQSIASLAGFPFPWKHLYGANLAFYGGADVDANQWVWEWLPPLMKARGVWGGYEQTYEIHLSLDRARGRGIPVNEGARVELEGELRVRREKLDVELQKEIPDECRQIAPKRKDKETGETDYGYIREPRHITQYFAEYENASRVLQEAGKTVKSFEYLVRRKFGLVVREFSILDSRNGGFNRVRRWCRLVEWKASKDGLVRYLKWKKGELEKELEEMGKGKK